MTKPKWKTLQYKGIKYDNYLIYSDGRVWSKKTHKFFEKKTDKKGYWRISLRREGEQKELKIHILVAEAFIGARPIGYTIDHIDGNKNNNDVSNLEYVTNLVNHTRARKMGLYDVHKTRIKGVDVMDGSSRYWDSIQDAAIELLGEKKKYKQISRCIHGKKKECAGYIWFREEVK